MSTVSDIQANLNMLAMYPGLSGKVSAFLESVMESNPMAAYGYDHNGSRLQPLTEATVDRILQHGQDGMIILSADRVERSESENYQKRHELLGDIKAMNLSFIVVYGGYRDLKANPPKTANGETSFVIPAHYRNGEKVPWDIMFQFAKDMCGKYDQDSVLVQEPGKGPIYIDHDGNKVMDLGGPVVKNDLKQEYFSSLIKAKHYDEANPDRLKRFSFTEPKTESVLLVNPPPCTQGEMRRRGAEGEIFALWDEIPKEIRR
jgi:hypothetical protein